MDRNDSAHTELLSSRKMKRGRRLVRRFATLNGISVALLMDSVLILYAIRNGVGDVALALLASFVHLSMPLMILGKGRGPALRRRPVHGESVGFSVISLR